MKKKILIVLAILLVAAMTAAFAACTPNDDQDLCANGHSWDDGTPKTPATCESAGETVYRCKMCGETETRPEPAKLGHDYALQNWTWDEYDSATAHFTCTRGDLTATQDVTDDDLQAAVQPDGSTVYTASVTGPDGETYTDTRTKQSAAHEHTKGTEHPEVPATCTNVGTHQYWDCEADDGVKLNAAGEEVTDTQLTIPALGHTYEVNGPLTWKDTATYLNAELHLVCNVCAEGVEGHTLDVELKSEQSSTSATTCGAMGSITFTVSVEYEDNAAAIAAAVSAPSKLASNALEGVEELTYTKDNAQLGHQWKLAEEGAYDWTGTTKDGSSVAVKYVCERCSKEITLTFTDATSNSTPATCTAAEQIEYTLTKTAEEVRTAAEAAELQDVTIYDADTFEAITDQKHTVQGAPANGHTWQVTEVTWAQEYETEPHATVTVKCSVCETAYDGADTEVTFAESKQAPKCEEDGSVTYTVTVKIGEDELDFAAGVKSTSDPYTIPQTGHNFDKENWKSDETQHWYECQNDASHRDSVGTHQWIWENTGDGTHEKKCETCGYVDESDATCSPDAGETGHDPEHKLASGWYATGDEHWQICVHCGEEYGREAHNYNDYQSETCLDCGHTHMQVEINYNESDVHHVDSVVEAFAWIAQQAKETTYTVRLNHNRSGDSLTLPAGYTVVLDLESFTLEISGALTVTEGSLTVQAADGELTIGSVIYSGGTLVLPQGDYEIDLQNGLKCKDDGVHITIGGVVLDHNYGALTSEDDFNHSKTCSRCGDIVTTAHNYCAWTYDNDNHTRTCQDAECAHEQKVAHTYEQGSWSKVDETQHQHKCDVCDYVKKEDHSVDEWTEKTAENHSGTCSVCTETITEAHTFGDPERVDDYQHTKHCDVCQYDLPENHDWGEGDERHDCACGEKVCATDTITLDGKKSTATETHLFPSSPQQGYHSEQDRLIGGIMFDFQGFYYDNDNIQVRSNKDSALWNTTAISGIKNIVITMKTKPSGNAFTLLLGNELNDSGEIESPKSVTVSFSSQTYTWEAGDDDYYTYFRLDCKSSSAIYITTIEIVPLGNHLWNDGKVTEDGSCADGTPKITHYECLRCGETKDVEEKVEHVFEGQPFEYDGANGHHQKCANCETYNESVPCTDTLEWETDKDNHRQYCTACQHDYVAQTGHTFSYEESSDSQHRKYCEECGWETLEAHSPAEGPCDHCSHGHTDNFFVDGKGYASLSDAVAQLASASDKTISIKQNVTDDGGLTISEDFTLDLGSATLTLKAGLTFTGTVTIRNGAIAGEGMEYLITLADAAGSLTLQNVTINGETATQAAVRVTNGTLTLDAATLIGGTRALELSYDKSDEKIVVTVKDSSKFHKAVGDGTNTGLIEFVIDGSLSAGDLHIKVTFEAAQTQYPSLKITSSGITCEDLSEVTFAEKQISHTYSEGNCSICGAEQPASKWTLVTDESMLSVGDKIVIAINDKNNAVATTINKDYLGIDTTCEFSADKKTITSLPESAVIFVLGKTDGGYWTLTYKDTDSDKLLGATAVKKVAWDKGTTTWTISVTAEGKASITNTTASYGTIYYNSGSPRFTTYTSTQVLPQIYVLK